MVRLLARRADPQHRDGIRQVPPDIVDAARGMGMGDLQVLARVELPLALPLIVAGLRVAAVTVISVSVVAAVRERRRPRHADLQRHRDRTIRPRSGRAR
jgi:hypothetical protein